MSAFCALVPSFIIIIVAGVWLSKSGFEFLGSAELWANIVGGIVAAIAVAVLFWLKDRRKRRILDELAEILDRVIKHRIIGKNKTFTDVKEWIRQAEDIENEAIEKATELSPTAGALIASLDRLVQPWNNKLSRSVAILATVSTRIRELLERNS